MNYRISRTSCWDDDIKPCDEAYMILVEHWDIRTCTEDYFNNVIGKTYREKPWSERGTSHCRITPSHKVSKNGSWIARRLTDKEVWVIDINSLEDLNKFVLKYGRCVISRDNSNQVNSLYNTIEIYDDYRE